MYIHHVHTSCTYIKYLKTCSLEPNSNLPMYIVFVYSNYHQDFMICNHKNSFKMLLISRWTLISNVYIHFHGKFTLITIIPYSV